MSVEDPDIFVLHAQFCKIFANPVRLRVMWELRMGERTVSDLAEALEVSVSNISQHLRVMRSLGVVATRRDGQRQYYRTTSDHFLVGCRHIRQGVQEVMAARRTLEVDSDSFEDDAVLSEDEKSSSVVDDVNV
jgi:DNA-binding transcriptional ArsR family regulator